MLSRPAWRLCATTLHLNPTRLPCCCRFSRDAELPRASEARPLIAVDFQRFRARPGCAAATARRRCGDFIGKRAGEMPALGTATAWQRLRRPTKPNRPAPSCPCNGMSLQRDSQIREPRGNETTA